MGAIKSRGSGAHVHCAAHSPLPIQHRGRPFKHLHAFQIETVLRPVDHRSRAKILAVMQHQNLVPGKAAHHQLRRTARRPTG
ncbi:hypothetical protein Amal_03376 [Acetobacter malorum]|uniref:Uncharacterized protein n=1 Tax=Acetobacter malorum TaxID=178901 RepID=A0A177G544_9PROT|nr:hypothetical protein Amal_03376 [Acetobacter malorum]